MVYNMVCKLKKSYIILYTIYEAGIPDGMSIADNIQCIPTSKKGEIVWSGISYTNVYNSTYLNLLIEYMYMFLV